MQLKTCSLEPVQLEPPLDGGGLSHFLDLDILQLIPQVDHEDQSPHPPLILHSPLGQEIIFLSDPVQLEPPLDGDGLSHCLDLVILQLLPQVVHEDHSPHSPLT